MNSSMQSHGRSPEDRHGRHRFLPIVGSSVAVAAVLAHLIGGGVLVHVGLPAVLVYLGRGAVPTNFVGGALLIGLAAVITIKLLFVFGATRHWGNKDGWRNTDVDA